MSSQSPLTGQSKRRVGQILQWAKDAVLCASDSRPPSGNIESLPASRSEPRAPSRSRLAIPTLSPGPTLSAANEPNIPTSPPPAPPSKPMVPEGSRGDIIKHKDSGNDAWKGLISSLHTLESSSGLFPPLKAAVGAVIGCIGVVQRATSNRADQAALAEELQFMVETLNLYSTGLESESKSGSIANLAQYVLSLAS
ncbi:unnamed protein product [Rhizoctonia solani]|uniref:Vegetative incompatibility protein HET-E-1 n=1 Tax=Rhizoctonia solani TaxID=456999 RepID=A0A8H3DMF1_9AGAM|nr:unnamed protein product [Rhizoctonia solani]CAE6527722.1 unnamed protein product [Rhizoctonia solani]